MSESDKKQADNQHIYLNIDHLKKGEYTFNFIVENKVYKSVKIKKIKDNKSNIL